MLLQRRAIVVTGGQCRRIHRHLQLHRAGRLARAQHQPRHRRGAQVRGPEAPRAGHEALDLALRADDGDLLLVARALGEHAQLQQRARPGLEVDHGVGVIQDVGHAVGMALVLVVVRRARRGVDAHRAAARQQPHEVEEVTALLHQRAPGVAVEAVPLPDLVEEGVAMLADADHGHRAGGGLGVRLLHQAGDRRHVAVLHRHPHRGAGPARQRLQRAHLLERGAGRLLHQHRQAPQREDALKLLGVAEVRARDDDGVHIGGAHDLLQAGAAPRARRQREAARGHRVIRLEDARDGAARHERQVAQVLLAHHAAADEAVADRFHKDVNGWDLSQPNIAAPQPAIVDAPAALGGARSATALPAAPAIWGPRPRERDQTLGAVRASSPRRA